MATSNPRPGGLCSDTQETTIVSVDSDRQIAYAEYGVQEGNPVLFLHGTPGSHQLGALLGPAAQENGIRLIAPDRPGYGRSSPWPGRSIRDAAEFIMPVLDDAGIQTAGLIAFSGGSPYALSLAATQAHRINQVDVLAGATPPDVNEKRPTLQRVLAGLATTTPFVLQGLFRGQTWLAERMDPSFVVGQYTANGDAVSDATAEIVKNDFVEAFARNRSGAVTEFRNTATDWDINFGDIDVEVRFWHGSNDTNVPIEGVQRLEQRIPCAELHVLDDTDHLQTLLRSIPDVVERYR